MRISCDKISNVMTMRSFKPGTVFHEEVFLSSELVESFATFSGDRNPLHLKEDVAISYGYSHPVAHGAIQSAIVSKLIGMRVPGAGAVWMSQNMDWLRPAFVGETILVEVEVESFSSGAGILALLLRASSDSGEKLMNGTAKVKVSSPVAGQVDREEEERTRVALVTGGSRGIGAAAARALASKGCHVVIAYHSSRSKAERMRRELEGYGVLSSCVAVDLMKPGSGTSLVEKVLDQHGRLDVLVHGAAQSLPGKGVLETSAHELQGWIRMQVEASMELAQAVTPGMAEQKFGRMIFLGTSALFGAPPSGLCAYVTAKQALWGMVRCLAVELGPKNVAVNMISPGMTVTDLTSGIPQRAKEVEARKVSLRRLAVPDDVGRVIGFLASESASYITGQNIPLTGGPV